MCGLIGAAGDLTHAIRGQVFKDMLDVCQVRGRDSTGVIKVDQDLDYTWVRQIGPPNVLYESPVYENTIERGSPASILVAHTRHKTIGEVSVKNAHPFDYVDQGICGVHNGTLQMTYKLDGHAHNKVDSDILYNHLALNGPEETFNKTEGAWACVWWNDKEKTVNFIRNDLRPLYFTWSEDMKIMFWASEIWMFGVISRKVKLWDGGEDKKKYIELPINTLWSFRVNPKATGKEKIITLRTPKVIVPFERPTYQGGMRIGFHGGSWYGNNRNHVQRWREESPGHHVREEAKSETEKKDGAEDKAKGGSVVRPFPQVDHDKKVLNDSLEGIFGFREEETNTPMSNVAFLNTSAKRSGTSQEQTNTKQSSRKTLSLPGTSSKSSRQKGSDVLSGLPGGSSLTTSSSTSQKKSNPNSFRQSNRVLCKGVSFREVVGVSYITDNRTKEEYSFEEFYLNTGGFCSCCKEFFKVNLRNVGEFLDKKTVLCTTCLENPADRVLIQAANE